MNRYKRKQIPPIEIPYDEIEDYVVIPINVDSDQTRIYKLQSPYAKVELFFSEEIEATATEIFSSAEQDFGKIFVQIDSINVTLTEKEYSTKTVPFPAVSMDLERNLPKLLLWK